MTKVELLADLSNVYEVVGTPRLTQSSDDQIPSAINNYSVIVYETGYSEKNKKPVINTKYVDFVVHNEGEAEEAAYYVNTEPENDTNTDITGTGALIEINKIYESSFMRKRVQAAVAKAAQDIFGEALPDSLLTVDASSDQKNVTVAAGYVFWVGKVVVISDSGNSEEATIASISSNTLTMSANLTNSYTVGNGAKVTFKDDVERQQWASNAMLSPDVYTLAMANFVALNPTILAAGGEATDNDIQYVVNSNVNKIASVSYSAS